MGHFNIQNWNKLRQELRDGRNQIIIINKSDSNTITGPHIVAATRFK